MTYARSPGPAPPAAVGRSVAVRGAPALVEAHHRHAARAEARRPARARVTSTRGARVGQHEGQPLGGVRGVQRHVGAARLEHAQDRHDHLRAALQHSATGTSGPTPSARRWCASRLARASSSP